MIISRSFKFDQGVAVIAGNQDLNGGSNYRHQTENANQKQASPGTITTCHLIFYL